MAQTVQTAGGTGTGSTRNASGAGAKIRKFTRKQMFIHWAFAISYLTLAVTGSIFLWRPDPTAPAVGLGVLFQGSTGQIFRLVHRGAAVAFLLVPLLYFLLEPRRFLADMKELVTYTVHDLKWSVTAPLHYTFGKPALPPQRKYNVGQKLNYLLVVITFVTFSVSGITMWFFRGSVSADTLRMALAVHSASFFLNGIFVLLHLYLTLLHPFTRRSLEAMKTGFLPLDYAKAEHSLWVEEEVRSGRAEIVEESGT